MHHSAIVLANGHYRTGFAKTSHGLVRGPSRYPLAGVVDKDLAGQDAGTVLDGKRRNIPVFASVRDALARLDIRPTHCVIGIATVGGFLPEGLYADLEYAARAGLTLVNGLHHLLAEDARLAKLASKHGGGIIDIRAPRPASELRSWSGDILSLSTPRVAFLGTDCAVGKRTTCMMVREECRSRGIRAEMIYSGQTGWLQGLTHGFIFDATLNDFVCGELEGAILACHRDTQAEIILLEGQSSLRNPSGPAGSEFLLSGAVHGVVLTHSPHRTHFVDFEEINCRIPPIEDEIRLINLYGVDVWAITLASYGLPAADAAHARDQLAAMVNVPVVLPLEEGVDYLADILLHKAGL